MTKVTNLLALSLTVYSVYSYPLLNTRLSAKPNAGNTVNDTLPWPTDDGFPSLGVYEADAGYRGPTPTGKEAAAIQTAPTYPYTTDVPPSIIKPKAKDVKDANEFNLLANVGVLTPYRSGMQILKDATPLPPKSCSIDSINVIHRHGSRYPTSNSASGPLGFANKISKAVNESDNVEFNDELEFLADWEYKLGSDILTPAGRQQEYDSGVGFRLKYGYLLNTFKNHKPVVRTTTQDRMFRSAANFLSGFFGADGGDDKLNSYQQFSHLVQIIESPNFNNTLNPENTCKRKDAKKGSTLLEQWTNVYLQDALSRLQPQTSLNLTIDDVKALQDLCAYESVALGYSDFCKLFTKDEWDGYEYATDLEVYGDAQNGSPTAKALGVGWVQELLSRLTNDRKYLTSHYSTINTTLDESEYTFPLDQKLNIDFSHDTVISRIIAALNLTHLSGLEPLPADHIPFNYDSQHLRWKTSELVPFAANLIVQTISCEGSEEIPKNVYNRIVINDAVHPLDGINQCKKNKFGLCEQSQFIEGLEEIIDNIDFANDCYGDYVANQPVKYGIPEIN